MLEFRILGPLEVCAGGSSLPLGGTKPRALLAVLAVHANQPVSAERLALALWGEEVPPSAVKTIQVYVARLRKVLGDPDALVTTPAGYRLRVRPGELDAERFERQVAAARQALEGGRAQQAASQLREALAEWRGPPLAEFASVPFAPAETARLEEQRLAALGLRVDADLAAGGHAELVGELQQLTAQHPWREQLHAQLMLALYRSGRQAEALEAYRHAREVLVSELGLEPGAELRQLHEAILAHDPALVAPAEPASPLLHRVLPTPPNRTIGREHDLTAVGERVCVESVRLLTLTGPGGVGKTRLAIEVARTVEADFGDGAAFVSLAAVQRAEEVPAAIVGTLEITLIAGESPADAVERYLGDRQLLLVADNFEHVLDAASFVARLLDACPALTVLATSREPLALAAEERFPVAPIAAADAIALFAERARGIDPGFELDERSAGAVTEICRRLDGLPLAIELAAARCGLLSPAELAERLGDALGALGEGARDAPARQRTLRTTIEWSHDLLSGDEQAAFAHFAVFAGAPDVEAAEAITGARLDTLDRLLAKSLLVRRRAARSTTRLAMLETIRAFAAERLAARSDGEALRERHFRHYLALAERHGSDRALWGSSHHAHLAELDANVDDLHGALGWAVRRPGGYEALRLCAALSWYWLARDRHADALEWSEQALSVPGADAHPVLRARVLCLVAAGLWGLGRAAEQPPILAEAEALARTYADPVQLARVLEFCSVIASGNGHFERGDALADEALSLAGSDLWTTAMAARASVLAAPAGAHLHERVDRAVSLLERAGNHFHLASMLASASYGALVEGNYAAARAYIERAIPIAQELDNPHMWMLVRGNEAMAALLSGDLEAARRAFREELRLCRDLGFVPFVFEGLRGLAAIAAEHDHLDRAARLCGAGDRHRHGQPDDAAQAQLDASFDAARARRGADAWDTAFREGTELSVAEAIAFALG